MGEKLNLYGVLVGKPEGKMLLEGRRCRCVELDHKAI
jgi:hypothetical protein